MNFSVQNPSIGSLIICYTLNRWINLTGIVNVKWHLKKPLLSGNLRSVRFSIKDEKKNFDFISDNGFRRGGNLRGSFHAPPFIITHFSDFFLYKKKFKDKWFKSKRMKKKKVLKITPLFPFLFFPSPFVSSLLFRWKRCIFKIVCLLLISKPKCIIFHRSPSSVNPFSWFSFFFVSFNIIQNPFSFASSKILFLFFFSSIFFFFRWVSFSFSYIKAAYILFLERRNVYWIPGII